MFMQFFCCGEIYRKHSTKNGDDPGWNATTTMSAKDRKKQREKAKKEAEKKAKQEAKEAKKDYDTTATWCGLQGIFGINKKVPKSKPSAQTSKEKNVATAAEEKKEHSDSPRF